MSATRTQIYLTVEQRAELDRRAHAERKTLAQLIREAVDRYLAEDVGDDERARLLADTFGASPGFGALVPLRDEWARG